MCDQWGGCQGNGCFRGVNRDTLVVGTRQAEQLATVVAAAVADGILVREVIAADRTLEGIFGRLVQLHRGVER